MNGPIPPWGRAARRRNSGSPSVDSRITFYPLWVRICMGGSRELGGEIRARRNEVDCIACGGSLYFLPDSYPLAFTCRKGHFMTLKDILDKLLLPGEAPSESALQCWEGKAMLLHRLAARALKAGHAFTAADFQETANRVDEWVAKLRVLLPRQAPAPPVTE